MHRKRPLLVAAFLLTVVIHPHHDSNSRFVVPDIMFFWLIQLLRFPLPVQTVEATPSGIKLFSEVVFMKPGKRFSGFRIADNTSTGRPILGSCVHSRFPSIQKATTIRAVRDPSIRDDRGRSIAWCHAS
jgi:hypothetical protein